MALSAEQRAKLQQQVDQINLKSDAEKTRNDYNAIAALNNWATVYAPNYGTNGRDTIDAGNYTGVGKILGDGSYQMKDVDAATYDSTHYYYDIRLDPRSNNGAGNAIQDVLQSANLRASQEAAQGLGNYNDLLNKYYAQIGYTDANGVYDSLQKTGTLGLKTLDGKSIEEAYKLGNYDPNSTINYDREYYTSGQFDRDRAAARDAQWEYLESLPVYQQGQVYDGAVTEFNNNGTVLKTGGNGGMGGMGGQGSHWGYNMNSDPVWNSYKNEYTREGNQAMNDTVAQLAARTGGMASSYAGQVGQQAYDQYMQEMTDKIPVLEQNAYNRYMDDQNLQLQREQMNNQLDLQRQQLALQQQAQDWSQQQSAASAAAAKQSDNYSNLMNLMSKYGYQPSDQELAAAGMSGNLRDAVLQLGQYAPQQASATGYWYSPKIVDDKKVNDDVPKPIEYNLPITTTASAYEFNTYLDQAKKIRAQGGSSTDFVAKMLQAGMIDEIQAQYILRQMGLI